MPSVGLAHIAAVLPGSQVLEDAALLEVVALSTNVFDMRCIAFLPLSTSASRVRC